MKKAPIVITMGDPAGIGPEVTVKAQQVVKGNTPFFVIGDYALLKKVAHKYSVKTELIESPAETLEGSDKLFILDNSVSEPVKFGTISLENQMSVVRGIRKAVSFLKDGSASALVTNPICKWALQKGASFKFSGHTDFLQFLDNPKSSKPVMMLANKKGFRVVPTTIHIPLKKVSQTIKPSLIERTILTVHNSLNIDFGITDPKILVTGLNPHAGENKMLGTEEITKIKPVIKKLSLQGLKLDGPVPADTAFVPANRSYYDGFICMYHDQALIPIKTLGFEDAINVTLGLSFVRTSPDHGTGFDISGKGCADPSSLIYAIQEARKIADTRNFHKIQRLNE